MRAVLFAWAVLSIPGCPSKADKDKADAAAASSASAATTTTTASAPVVIAKPDAGSAQERADIDQAASTFEEIEALVNKGTLKDSTKPDAPDAQARCASFEKLRPKLEKRIEPEVKNMLDEEKRVCSFDVPLLVAEEGLKQLGLPGSQASKQLSCQVASREIEKARAVKSDDNKLRMVDARYHSACK